MPYNPQVQYRGDEFWFKGITGAAEELSSALKKYDEDKKNRRYNEGIFESLKSSGQVSPEAIAAFHKASPDKQRGIIFGEVQAAHEKHLAAQEKRQQDEATSLISQRQKEGELTSKILEGYGKPVSVAGKQIGIGGSSGPSFFPARDIAPANANQQILDPEGNAIGERGPTGEPHFYPKETIDQLKQQREDRADEVKQVAEAAAKASKKANKPAVSFARGFPELTSNAPTLKRTPVKVNSPGEARKLPKGTPIILPDGTLGTVP